MRLALLVLTLALVTSACSQVKFSDDKSSGGSANALGDDGKYSDGDETGDRLNQPPGTNPPGSNPPTTSNPPGGNPPGTNPPGTNPPGTNPPGTNPPGDGSYIPKVVFIGPPCMRGSACLAEFRLDRAYAMAVDFDWRTDDTLYTQTPPPGEPIYGQPGVHYVAKTGHVTFAPGETVKQISIQNINPYTYAITIGVRMSACRYGGASALCRDLFRP